MQNNDFEGLFNPDAQMYNTSKRFGNADSVLQLESCLLVKYLWIDTTKGKAKNVFTLETSTLFNYNSFER
jgi:hypothetical protein